MRYRWLLLLLLGLLTVLPTPALSQNEIRLHWDRYDTIVNINADGTLRVQEQQILVVDQGTLRRMTREFETGSNGQVRNIRVVEDGQAYRPGTDTPGTYSGSDNGSDAAIQLWFRDPNATQHTFSIEYTVAQALVASGDQARLDWSFFWSSPNAPEIRAGSVEIQLPGQVGAADLRLAASGVPVELTSDSNPIRWELTSPIQGSELDVQVTFPRAVLVPDASFRSAQRNTQPRANQPVQPQPVPGQVPDAALAAGGFSIVFCLIVLFFLFIAFIMIRASAQTRNRRGYPPAYGPAYSPDPFAGPLPRGTRRRRRHRGMGGWGGWGGGFFPPIIINPPNQPRDQGGPFNSPLDGSAGRDSSWGDSGGSSSSWGDSGGSSSSWGDSGGSSSSWGDSGGGGSSWGGGGGGGDSSGGSDNGGSGGGSFG